MDPRKHNPTDSLNVAVCPMCGADASDHVYVCNPCCTRRPWSFLEARAIMNAQTSVAEARMRLFHLGERLRAEGKLSMWTADKGGEPIEISQRTLDKTAWRGTVAEHAAAQVEWRLQRPNTLTETVLAKRLFVLEVRDELERRAVERCPSPAGTGQADARKTILRIMWGEDPVMQVHDEALIVYGTKKAERILAEQRAAFVFKRDV